MMACANTCIAQETEQFKLVKNVAELQEGDIVIVVNNIVRDNGHCSALGTTLSKDKSEICGCKIEVKGEIAYATPDVDRIKLEKDDTYWLLYSMTQQKYICNGNKKTVTNTSTFRNKDDDSFKHISRTKISINRNNIAIIINYMKNIDTEDFMKNDHRKMVENLQNEINLDMAEICKLLASKNLDVDNYRIFRSNISRNVANMNGTSLSLTNASYDVLYHEYGALSDMLRGFKKPMDTPKPEESHEEPTPIPSEETPIELPPVDNNPIDSNPENEVPENFEELNPSNDDIPVEGDDLGDDPLDEVPLNDDSLNDESLDDSSLDDDLDDEVEREPVKNSPLSQFRDKFKRSVKGISKASGKLKGKIDAKVFRKAALRWTGVVGVLAVAAVINPALLLGGAAVGAGLYEYNVAKKMK